MRAARSRPDVLLHMLRRTDAPTLARCLRDQALLGAVELAADVRARVDDRLGVLLDRGADLAAEQWAQIADVLRALAKAPVTVPLLHEL